MINLQSSYAHFVFQGDASHPCCGVMDAQRLQDFQSQSCSTVLFVCPSAGQTGSFLNMAPEVVLGERYNETAVRRKPCFLLAPKCTASLMHSGITRQR